MKAIIIRKLSDIAAEYGIQIVYACESGSRAWQFPSPDSDYDVRFIYIRPFDDYLSISERNDQIGFLTDGELDICGWDIRKALQLTRKSNTTLFEWLQSPIVYLQQPGFRDELWALCEQYFDRRSNIHHYLGIAHGALETMGSEGEIKIKKLFYVLRPLLAAKWCVENDSIAPMSILPLMCLMPKNLQQLTTDLIALKSTKNEDYMVEIAPELKQFIVHEFATCTEAAADMQKQYFEVAPLDVYFRKIIKQK